MHSGRPEFAFRQIRAAVTAHLLSSQSDRWLLEQFIDRRDESAFAALLERHAPMVLCVCRRALADRHLAEDVLQATFLLLARKAASIRRRDSVGPWLHAAALRLARRAAAELARSRQGPN
jgi:DNA-directed RNA polymerase specialized sigma24 family protein